MSAARAATSRRREVFDPAAWVAQYEALGGHVSVARWPLKQEGLFLCMTIPRRWPAHVRRLNDALNDPPGDMARSRALMDYVVAARGIQSLG